ncbi:MAG TPA: replicative DNA helicase [Phycisphaerales bacterium]|nr:replicative DNA helicase [Phycisphaerales bacterium]
MPRRGPAGPTPPRDLQKLFDRLPPASPEAEMSLLGSMILDPKVIGDVIAVVRTPDDFAGEAHAHIFDALVKTYDVHRSGDLVQLSQSLRDRGVLDDIGGPDYLLELAQAVPSAASAPHYARIVREKAQLRRLIEAAGRILYDAYHAGDPEQGAAREVLDRAEQAIFAVAEDTGSADLQTLERLLQDALNLLDANFQHGRTLTGLSTGFYDLDQMTNGLQAGEMVIVAARPSMGKTAFALNLAEQIAFGGSPHAESGPRTPVGFFSMEMSRQSVAQRLMCAHSGVDSHKMRRNLLSHDDFRRLAESCGKLSEAPVFIDDSPGLTVMLLRAKARRMVAQHGVKCVFIDYMQLMSAPGAARESRQAEVSAISRGLKALARELEVPIVCLAQLNRGAEQREGHRPRMADLRESGSIEQDADVIMLLHRESYYHQHDPEWLAENEDRVNDSEVIIAKQRNGPTGTVHLKWNAQITRFQSMAQRHGSDGNYEVRTKPVSPASPGSSGGSRSSYAPGAKSGPVQGHRDGGGPERDWQSEEIDDLPI